MNKLKTARLAGLVQSIPGICTFVRPVFETEDGKVCLQRTEQGNIVGWDVFERDASIVLITSAITRSIGQPAIVGYESEPGHVLIGDVLSVATSLSSSALMSVQLKESRPGSYEAIQNFCSAVRNMKLPLAEEPLLEERPVAFVTLEQAEIPDTSMSLGKSVTNTMVHQVKLNVMRKVGKEYKHLVVWDKDAMPLATSHEIDGIVHLAQANYLEQLSQEATLLLGQRLLAEKAVLEVFRKWREQLSICAVPRADLSSIRSVFRPHIYETMCSISSVKDVGQYRHFGITPARDSAANWLKVSRSPSPDLGPFYYSRPSDNDHSRKFRLFQSVYPEAACVFYWIYQDHLSLIDVCNTIGSEPEQVLEFLSKGQQKLRHCLYRDETGLSNPYLLDMFWVDPISSVDVRRVNVSPALPKWFKCLAHGTSWDIDEVTRREIDAIRVLMKGVGQAAGLNDSQRVRGFGVADVNGDAARNQAKDRLN